MHESYSDIRSRIHEEPLWFTDSGVPRYDPYSPTLSPNVYADISVLMLIACQYCNERFQVELNGDWLHSIKDEDLDILHFGDPPRHGCAGGGETMNCEDLALLQVWKRGRTSESLADWIRHPELERVFTN